MRFRSAIFLLGLFVLVFPSCGDDEIGEMMMEESPFDRRAMLTFWADQVIIPAFENYLGELNELILAKDRFLSEPGLETLDGLRETWLSSYLAWQEVSIFDIGKAEEVGLRNFTNIYPSDIEDIEKSIIEGNHNLELPSNFDIQGFPALDYILFGLESDEAQLVERLSTENHASFLSDLVERLHGLASEVSNDWNNGYRDLFIANDGASATASVDKITNDFIFYYERFLRAGKIGIPAGVFSGNPISSAVEAPHSEVYSKELFLRGFGAAIEFFNGVDFNNSTTGPSLSSYLNHVANQRQTSNIADEIREQWRLADLKAQDLSPSFKSQILTDNTKMLETYDELQKAVVLLKVEMMQALNIQVDFVDADGD